MFSLNGYTVFEPHEQPLAVAGRPDEESPGPMKVIPATGCCGKYRRTGVCCGKYLRRKGKKAD